MVARDIFRSVKLGEVLADDLVRCVALDIRRALVPTCDASLRVQKEDRIVGDARHKQPEKHLRILVSGRARATLFSNTGSRSYGVGFFVLTPFTLFGHRGMRLRTL